MAYDNSLAFRHHTSSEQYDEIEGARTGFFSFIVPADFLQHLMSAAKNQDFENNDGKTLATDDGSSLSDALRLSVTSAPVPNFSLETLKFTRGNDTVNFAGKPEFKSGTLKFDDFVGLDTKDILYAWLAAAYDVTTGKGGRMKNYKAPKCTLIEYTQEFKPIRSWIMYGCWISSIDDSDFDKENDGKRQLSATIVYDRAELDYSATDNLSNYSDRLKK